MSIDSLLNYLKSAGMLIFQEGDHIDIVVKYESILAFRDLLREIECHRRKLTKQSLKGEESVNQILE
jgi:hypothetical protein